MAKQYQSLNPKLRAFILDQKIFFTASAAKSSRVNVSPRSTEHLKVVDDNCIIYLDQTGSGNETAAHIEARGQMTIMFVAFEEPPQILRLYGRGEVIHREGGEYSALLSTWFENNTPCGARQIVRLAFDLVQTSCGFGVPLFDYKSERETLQRWAASKTEAEIEDFWRTKNQTSLDGLPSHIFKDV